jgi:hypothetical protein
MTREQLRQVVHESLRKFFLSRHRETVDITSETDPINEVGLASEDGVDWACDLEELGINVPAKVNPFVIDGEAKRSRRFGEIVDLLYGYVEHKEEAEDE